MNDAAIGRLYDALHSVESRYRRGTWPVHKRLQFEEPSLLDIYDWILENVSVHRAADVLDAGCGGGFGTFRLAQHFTGSITGISLSAEEVSSATTAARRLALGSRVQFFKRSFDEIAPAGFDLIVAVESLKHSADVGRSVATLSAALRPGGQLIIIDDFAVGTDAHRQSAALCSDWDLERLYSLSDYVANLGDGCWQSMPFAAELKSPNPLTMAMKRAALSLCIPLSAPGLRRALRAFRGGLILEQLYARGLMKYEAIFIGSDS